MLRVLGGLQGPAWRVQSLEGAREVVPFRRLQEQQNHLSWYLFQHTHTHTHVCVYVDG